MAVNLSTKSKWQALQLPNMETQIFYTAAFIAVLLLLLSRYLLRRSSNKRLPPSPTSLPIIGHFHLLKQPLHLSLASLAARYGPIVFLRLGSRPAIIVSSPTIIEQILSKHDTVFSNHPSVHAGKVLCYNNTSMFVAPYGSHWRNLRRLTVIELLSMSRINSLSAVRAEELFCMVRRMRGRREVELKGRLFEMTYNVMSKMVAGRRFYGEDVEETEMEIANRFKEIFDEGLELVFAFNPRDYFPALGWADLAGVEKKMERLRPRFDRFLNDLVEEHRRKRAAEVAVAAEENGKAAEERESKRTLIDVMLSMQETDPEAYTNDLIKGQIMTVLTGGSDTVAQTIEATMLLLLCHPSIMSKVRAEIDSNTDPNQLLKELDLPNLPYLHCAIKESLRLVMPMQGLPPRASSEDCTIAGYHIPRGTTVFVNAWGMQREPGLWEDPMEFKPERFEGHVGGREGFRYIPFGAGRRGCPGENLGMRMVALAVGTLVQCFEWDKMTAEDVDLDAVLALKPPRSETVVARYSIRESMREALSKI